MENLMEQEYEEEIIAPEPETLTFNVEHASLMSALTCAPSRLCHLAGGTPAWKE